MPTTEIDKVLVAAITAAKSKEHHFAIVAKGPTVVHLLVSKMPIKDAEVLKAKKDHGGNAIIRGTCQGRTDELVFRVADEPTVHVNKLKEFISQATKLAIKPQFDVVKLASEAGDEGSEIETESSQEPNTTPAIDSVAFTTRLKALKPELDAVRTAETSVTAEVKTHSVEVVALAGKGLYAEATKILDLIEPLLKKGLAELATKAEHEKSAKTGANVQPTTTPTSGSPLPPTPQPTVQPTQPGKLAGSDLEEAKLSCLKSWASPEYGVQRKKGLDTFVRGVLAAFAKAKEIEYSEGDVSAIIEHIRPYEDPSTTEFESVIKGIGQGGGSKGYVDHLLEVVSKFTANQKPTVVRGPALTGANFDTAKNVITIDPSKITDPTALLDYITFEIQNAVQRKALREATRQGGAAVAEIEFTTDVRYVESLKKINKVSSIEELVATLGVPEEFLVEVSFDAALKAKKVDRPSKAILPRQDMRQALWYWKTKAWSDEQKKLVWMNENHSEDVGSSVDIYEEQARSKK